MNQINILEDLFTNRISVKSIANEIMPVNSLEEARVISKEKNFDLHLINNLDDDILVYIKATDSTRPIKDIEVISETTPLLDAIQILVNRSHVFIKEKTIIKYIASKADLDSISVRIWLYGMINLLEIELRNHVQKSKINWMDCLSEEKQQQINNLYKDKKKHNVDIDLLNCIQLSDYAKILKKKFKYFEFAYSYEKNPFCSMLNSLIILRNNLAHAETIRQNWEEILRQMEFITEFLKFVPKPRVINKEQEIYM